MTTGVIAPQVLRFDDATSVTARAPGVPLTLTTIAAPPTLAAEAAPTGAGGWDAAIAANQLTPAFQPIQAIQLPSVPGVAAASMAVLTVPGSLDAHLELEATPNPGEGLLLMARNGDVVQWFVPANAALSVAGGAGRGLQGVGVAAPAPLRFRVPQSFLTSSVGTSPAGFSASSVAGSVLRFFRFPLVADLVQDVIDGAVQRTVAWIAREVEARAKTEAFLRFDPEHGFPAIADLSALRGQRVLLLTHGVFSSTTGAFAAFGAPGDPLLAHLRSVYGTGNIIGWDHHTISKTPLENAIDLLTRLPDGLSVDIICHSRGALVTRAMLEHPDLADLARRKITSVGSAIFIAGANQGSQLARYENLNRLLNIYSAIGSIPLLGSAGVALHVVVGVLRVLAHGVLKLPSLLALHPDPSVNKFLAQLNGPTMTGIKQLVVAHANYDARNSLLKEYLDWNVDVIFGTANDMVVPYTGAAVFDNWESVADQNNYRFGSGTTTQPLVMHTNFFYQPAVRDMIQLHTS